MSFILLGVKLLCTRSNASTDVLRIDEGTMLSPPERDDLARLLQEYQDIFTQGEDRRRLRNIALIPVTTLYCGAALPPNTLPFEAC
ncbi:hypothetical protein EVAR_61389_1 [Eumeta japonica]|uniref:Uncharacterized protein n=1 Tax=Eumeta variegata TaxID=151549 RepID=A0A4C1ZAN3_EUMVA|nr:hypothetical protein EVAR_61389_1 [Eumeta japonica]